MSNETWKTPAVIVAVLGLIVTIGTNFFQHYLNEEKLKFEKKKWNDEITMLREKLERETEDRTKVDARRTELEKELSKVEKDIKFWEDKIYEDKIQLNIMENEAQNKPEGPLKEADLKNVVVQKNMISQKKSLLDSAKKRRSEIENLLK